MKISKTLKTWLGIALFLVILLALLFAAQRLLMPKYMSGIPEGALPAEYYRETTDHDVIFVGDCEVYENFSPMTLWEEYGITSYIRGGPEQLIWQSYYTLEDTLRHETPKVVVFNVLSMSLGEPQSEAYNRMNLDGLRLSSTKLDAVRASMTEDETLLSYLFPLLRFHSRWSELSKDDFKYFFKADPVAHNGYLMRIDVKPKTQLPSKPVLDDYTLPAIGFEYLDKMQALCKDNGIQLILIKSPSEYPYWYEEWDAQVAAWAEQNEVPYLNMLLLSDEIGIDMQTDTYDGGMHLNLSGAEKLSTWFGAYLTENYALEDHRSDPIYADVYAAKKAAYDAEIADQQRQIDEYGKLIDIERANGN
ncbi:MAG: SGNH/GDSL hydrolase family protein [Firmicutes bacterium]|nr:SGNH/GDSL hydrolase family protein [Bacillota bacterium]